jgi:hypothetical protein
MAVFFGDGIHDSVKSIITIVSKARVDNFVFGLGCKCSVGGIEWLVFYELVSIGI